jgi:hypothetical protein
MPIRSAASLKIGTIIDKTLGVIEHNVMPVLLCVAGLTAVNATVAYFTVGMTRITDGLVIWFAGIAVGIVAAYLLVDAMIRRTGLRSRTEGDVFVAYCIMALLSTLGVIGGLILLVIPGLVFWARWIIAAPTLLARGGSGTRALGESWERTRGAEFQILVALLALLIGPIAVIVVCSMLFEPADPVGIGISQLASSLVSVISLAMGVAIYGVLESQSDVPSPAG